MGENQMSKAITPFPLSRHRRGAALGEYGLLGGLIALAAIASVVPLGERISKTYETAAETIEPDNVQSGVTDEPSEGTVVPDEPSEEVEAPPTPAGDVPGDDTTWVQISLGETAQSDLEDGSDRDWFRITIPQTANVHINAKEFSIDERSAQYLKIDFRSLDGSRIDENNSMNSVDLIINDVPAGDYFIDISSYRSSSFGGYEVYAALVDDITNTHGASSEPHPINSTSQGDILPGDEGDSFVFDVTEFGDYLFRSNGTGSSPMTYMNLGIYNASGNFLSGINSQHDSKVLLNDLGVGRYYARVRPYRGHAVGDYLFSSRNVEDVPGTASEAEPYFMGDVVLTEIFSSDDTDWFSFTTPTVGDYTFTIKENGASPLASMELEIRDATGTLINESRGSSSASVTISNLPAGDYTARVLSYRSKTGGYELQGLRNN